MARAKFEELSFIQLGTYCFTLFFYGSPACSVKMFDCWLGKSIYLHAHEFYAYLCALETLLQHRRVLEDIAAEEKLDSTPLPTPPVARTISFGVFSMGMNKNRDLFKLKKKYEARSRFSIDVHIAQQLIELKKDGYFDNMRFPYYCKEYEGSDCDSYHEARSCISRKQMSQCSIA